MLLGFMQFELSVVTGPVPFMSLLYIMISLIPWEMADYYCGHVP